MKSTASRRVSTHRMNSLQRCITFSVRPCPGFMSPMGFRDTPTAAGRLWIPQQIVTEMQRCGPKQLTCNLFYDWSAKSVPELYGTASPA